MRNIFTSFFFALGMLINGIACAQSVLNDDTRTERVVLTTGKSTILTLQSGVDAVVIGDDTVADVNVIASDKLYLLGKRPGSTNLQVSNSVTNDIIALDILVTVDTQELKRILDGSIDNNKLQVNQVGEGVLISGSVVSKSDKTAALKIAEQFVETVIDMISVDSEVQVQLRVDILEIATNRLRELGGLPVAELLLQGNGGSIVSSTLSSSFSFENNVRALMENGYAQYLASPTLTTLSGTKASFLAGGEIPIVSVVDGVEVVQYKEYGVRLSFTPLVLPDGNILVTLEPEVSQVDQTLSKSQGAAFSTRKAVTTASLKEGDTLMIAGLLQTTKSNGVAGLPLLAEIPLIGALFRASDFNDVGTEIVILVSPTTEISAEAKDSVNEQLDLVNPGDLANLMVMGKTSSVDRSALKKYALPSNAKSKQFGFMFTK